MVSDSEGFHPQDDIALHRGVSQTRHCETRSVEAIHKSTFKCVQACISKRKGNLFSWIASLPLAMTPFGTFRCDNVLKKKAAFTLAEVLITLGIIGIIAAMTLPMLIASYKKQEVEVRLKKFYSTFSNALLLSVAENGEMEYWDFPTKQNSGEQITTFVNKYLFPYFTGIKECSYNDSKSEGMCTQLSTLLYPSNYYRFPVYVFMDGGCFSILPGGSNGVAGWLHLKYDINCLGKPNESNKDIFAFAVKYERNKSFKFKAGGNATFNVTTREQLMRYCINAENSMHAEASCSALIQYDGWQIKDDYPYKL